MPSRQCINLGTLPSPRGAVRSGRRGRASARMACKPDSVPGVAPLRTVIPLGGASPHRSCCQPGPLGLKRPCRARLPGLRREAPMRHCSWRGLPCRSGCPSRGGLLPHRFTLTPGGPGAVSSLWRFPSGCPGRALPGAIASWSPDFPHGGHAPRATARPSAQGGHMRRRPMRQCTPRSPTIRAAICGGLA